MMHNKAYNILEIMLEHIKASKAYKQVLTVDELALYTGFSKSYIYKLTSQREIPHYKPIGRAIFFSKKEIDAWILRCPVPTIDKLLTKALTNIN